MRSRSCLPAVLLTGMLVGAGCGPQQEHNSTDTVKTQPVPTPKVSAKVNKPRAEAATKPAAKSKTLD